MPLTDLAIKKAKATDKPIKLTDGGGLYLYVTPAGGKSWRLKYLIAGREKVLTIGKYPIVPLMEAREQAMVAKRRLHEGGDPAAEKKQQKISLRATTLLTFENVAREWLKIQETSWTPRYYKNVISRLEQNIFPHLGNMPINDITTPVLLQVIRLIEERGAVDMARCMAQTCSQIFRYGTVSGQCRYNPAVDLRGALATRAVKHHAYLTASELPEFLSMLSSYNGDLLTRLAIRLLMLTFVRTAELRGAVWSEFDLEKAEWRIPAERMKMRDNHIVPLSRQAVAVLKQIHYITGKRPLVFPCSRNAFKPMSENTILYALYRMGYHRRATGHGFRATASTILNEHQFPADIIERQLAHAERKSVRAAYNHAQYLPQRREMMQWWADYLDRAVA
ncbi:MAG: tyrosine-type recombinase/integrase [Holosporales bacterium]